MAAAGWRRRWGVEAAVVVAAAVAVVVEAEAEAEGFGIVTTTCGSTIVPLLSFDRFRKNVSSGSPTPSELIVTSTVLQPLVWRERQCPRRSAT